MFGRHPRLPIDVEYEAANSLEDPDLVEPTDEDIEHALENLLSARKEAKELASKNIKSAQQKRKGYYDRKHSPETFEEGAEVLMENTAQKRKVNVNRLKKFNSNKVISLPQYHAMPFIMLYMCDSMYLIYYLHFFNTIHYMNRMVVRRLALMERNMMMRMMERTMSERRQVH